MGVASWGVRKRIEYLIIELSDSENTFEAYKGYDESEIKKIINKDSQIFNIILKLKFF